MKFLLKVILPILAIPAAHLTSLEKRILRGQEAKIKDFPYYASLLLREEYFCAAVLISTKHLLSSANCADSLIEEEAVYDDIKILIGSQYLRHGILYSIRRISRHKDFTKDPPFLYPNDISIIHLVYQVDLSPNIKPISLPPENARIPTGTVVIALGFGANSTDGKPLDPLLKLVSATCPLEKCQEAYSNTITFQQFCVIPERGTGCCPVDSGGPVVDFSGNILLGIVSVTTCCSDCRTPNIFIKVSEYLQYIHEELNYDFNLMKETKHEAMNYI